MSKLMMLDSNHGRPVKIFRLWMFKPLRFGILILNMYQRQPFHMMVGKISLMKQDINYMGHISFWMYKGQNIEEKLIHLYNYLLR